MKGILRRAVNNQSARCHQRAFGLLSRQGQNRLVSRNLSVVSFDKTHARISLPINSKIIEKGLISYNGAPRVRCDIFDFKPFFGNQIRYLSNLAAMELHMRKVSSSKQWSKDFEPTGMARRTYFKELYC